MERRYFLALAVGIAAGAAALTGTANAAPLAPASSVLTAVPQIQAVKPAVVSQDEVNQLKPQQVRWGHHWHHHHWHHRHWGRHHHHWHHRHWR